MLQLNFFREQKERVIVGLKKRNWSGEDIEQTVNEVLSLDETRRNAQPELRYHFPRDAESQS